MSLTAQTYLISQTSDAFYRSHLFVKLHDELEVIDTQFVPTFVEKDLYFDSLRKKWFRKGTAELTITNRKIFNLEFAKEAFPRHKVLVLDIGMTKSSLVVFQDGVFKVKEEELGMGQGLFNLLTPTKNRDEIFDFIPSDIDRQQVFDYLAEKTQYPARLPATGRERLIEFAAVKQIIKQFSENNQQSFLPPRQSIR
ncbi:hypothetical protein KC571_04230, partial [candidate division WWE3 bacterium]|nr:hypothetical protein [candidate division WWE3 bacterium]